MRHPPLPQGIIDVLNQYSYWLSGSDVYLSQWDRYCLRRSLLVRCHQWIAQSIPLSRVREVISKLICWWQRLDLHAESLLLGALAGTILVLACVWLPREARSAQEVAQEMYQLRQAQLRREEDLLLALPGRLARKEIESDNITGAMWAEIHRIRQRRSLGFVSGGVQ